ncbi:MAG: glycosyltransferase family 2 protein, partial [Fimbriimonadaceae bacterium]|nr:glycosyltransferase family 2 protein [Fimbriimonadaceae bacterium]
MNLDVGRGTIDSLLSVLIVNWNTRDHLERCLASLFRNPSVFPTEIIVVDNASNDGSAEMVQSQFPFVTLISPGNNTGYAAGNNLAFAVAEGEYLLTLNPDTELTSGALDAALGCLIAKKNAGVVGARLILPDGSVQRSVRGFPSLLGVFGALSGLDWMGGPLASYSLPEFNYERAGPAPQPMGTFLLFRRNALEEIGDSRKPFDEAFPIFFNEVDLLKRLADRGWKSWYEPRAVVHHHHGASTKQVKASMIWESHRSLVRYFRKHLHGTGRAVLPFLALVI